LNTVLVVIVHFIPPLFLV